MPTFRFALIPLSVLVAAGITVWGLPLAGPQGLVIALPLALIAAAALQLIRR
ncbi:hypothetical protein AB2B41_04180 [Marimonas sp. MJW-29]|uniref:Uncharacterized protein n=1 Tax=Sulfitobacter sediminis TaxID=3234186 RepID=A0ABV3RII6_9RHOB